LDEYVADMVKGFLAIIDEAVTWGWRRLLGCPGRASLFPADFLRAAPFPFLRAVRWSMASVVMTGALDPGNTMQAMLAENRLRFATGALLLPLAYIAARGVPIVARITETGAINAEHLVCLFPSVPSSAIGDEHGMNRS
jgi:hypothetical protein